MVLSVPTRRSRLAAVTLLVLALVFLVRLGRLADAAGYLGVLATGVVVLALVSAQALWFAGHVAARALAVATAALALGGQVLNLLVGLPGAQGLAGPPGALSLLGLVVEVATIVVLVIDRDRRSPVSSVRSPYAL